MTPTERIAAKLIGTLVVDPVRADALAVDARADALSPPAERRAEVAERVLLNLGLYRTFDEVGMGFIAAGLQQSIFEALAAEAQAALTLDPETAGRLMHEVCCSCSDEVDAAAYVPRTMAFLARLRAHAGVKNA